MAVSICIPVASIINMFEYYVVTIIGKNINFKSRIRSYNIGYGRVNIAACCGYYATAVERPPKK